MAGVRANYIIEDIQRCIHGLITKLISGTAPWTSWRIVYGWPTSKVFETFTKPFIYVMPPMQTDFIFQSGGGKKLGRFDLTIGAWDDRVTGSTEEINIISSRILALFNDPATVQTTQFNVTLDSAYTNTTLNAQGVKIESCVGPSVIGGEDIKEFRNEFSVTLRA
jgi:hypothetical protein